MDLYSEAFLEVTIQLFRSEFPETFSDEDFLAIFFKVHSSVLFPEEFTLTRSSKFSCSQPHNSNYSYPHIHSVGLIEQGRDTTGYFEKASCSPEPAVAGQDKICIGLGLNPTLTEFYGFYNTSFWSRDRSQYSQSLTPHCSLTLSTHFSSQNSSRSLNNPFL